MEGAKRVPHPPGHPGETPQAGPRFARCHSQPDPNFNILQTCAVNYEIPIQENHLLPSFTGQPGSGWRLGSQGAEPKANAISKRACFCSWLKGPDGCPRFSVIEELVNGAKHFSHDQNFTTVPLFSWDTPGAGWGEGAWDLVIDLGGNQMVSASELLHEAVQFWFQFLKKYHPTSGLSAPGGSKP